MSFCSLHVHDQYSLLDSVAKTEDLVLRAKQLGMSALGLTNHGNLFSHIKFYHLCQRESIQPILGVEAYVCQNSLEKDPKEKRTHLTMLASTQQGYQNLLKLVSLGYTQGFYYKPRIDWNLIEQYAEGLMCLSGCVLSELNQSILKNEMDHVKFWIERAKRIFGDRLFLEVTPVDWHETKICIPTVRELSQQFKVPLVATSDVHYVTPNDVMLREMVWSIQDKVLWETSTRKDTVKQYFLADETQVRLWLQNFSLSPHDQDMAIQSTQEIANRCQVTIDPQEYVMASFAKTSSLSAEEMLTQLCEQSYKNMMYQFSDTQKKMYRIRLSYELQVIKNMGLANYFLVVQDVLRFCRMQRIRSGPGRGSAAGSLVCFLLQITKVDPMKYGLLFERFLNPGRADSYPDIDLDIAHEQRGEVIDYLRTTYGHDHVANIVTFGTMGPKAVLKDVARSLGISFEETNEITKLIPQKIEGSPTHSLQQAIDQTPLLQSKQQQHKELFDIALRLENTPRHVSVHASAFLVTPRPINDIAPMYRDPHSEDLVCGIDMYDCEKIKLLKFDFLGLKTLSIEDATLKHIEHRYGKKIDLDTILFDDQKVWEKFCAGETIGTFQTETLVMRQLLKKIRPQNLYELSVVNAMGRPGPLNKKMDEVYARRKHGQEIVEILHESIEKILAPTYQVIVYQEQVMQIAEVFSGFTKAEADVLRKSMGKKKRELVVQMKSLFLLGAEKLGRPKHVAEKIFDLIEEFSEYAFNMSHSLAYSILSYQTMYLKTHYPAEFMCAVLNMFSSDQETTKGYLEECRRLHIQIIAPDINLSQEKFSLNDQGNILFGLSAIRDVGGTSIQEILFIRPFHTISEFYAKIKSVNKKMMRALIFSGCFDGLYSGRKGLWEYDMKARTSRKKIKPPTQESYLFDMETLLKEKNIEHLIEKTDFDLQEKLIYEKEYLGYYCSGHPLDEIKTSISRDKIGSIKEQSDMIQNRKVTIMGIVESMKCITTKQHESMAFATISDRTGNIDIVIFPRIFTASSPLLKIGNLVAVNGKVSLNQVIANDVELLTS